MKKSVKNEDEYLKIVVENIQLEEPTSTEEEPIIWNEDTELDNKIIVSQKPIEIELGTSSESSSNSSDSSDDNIEDSLVPKTTTPSDQTAKVKPSKYSYLSTNPLPFKKAMSSPNKDKWVTAANEELSNIEGHEVLDNMCNFPESFLHTLWMFKTKPANLSCQEHKKAT
ncbi:hypothetical protein PGT21_010550 [Puccinia graminis f. sp. tritici]|uniref:Uncharacterized protein n=1 Tax=Puccinia graminis f. sp. tritici TaxID=56615 RepID=A0A5B0N3S8_PUCGR|nr:hypothetical protein PGTUg99_023644 [Puccinia graminis f. sp. tritici]KAA1083885.1 hypothetical protein PGT21_010550 [Puccinia graminis f. sp. tritici]